MTALYLRIDASGVVRGTTSSPDPQPDDIITDHGLVAVDQPTYAAASGQIGACRYVNGALQSYASASIAPYGAVREQVGAVFLRAIVDLGWWDYFEAGAAHQAAPVAGGGAGKPYDGRAWATIGKTDRVMVLDAPLGRVARAAEAARVAASGAPAPAAPVITLGAAMDHGDAMVAAAAKAA